MSVSMCGIGSLICKYNGRLYDILTIFFYSDLNIVSIIKQPPIAILQGSFQNNIITIETPAITAIQFSNETKNCIMHNAYAPAFIPY